MCIFCLFVVAPLPTILLYQLYPTRLLEQREVLALVLAPWRSPNQKLALSPIHEAPSTTAGMDAATTLQTTMLEQV